VPEALEEDADAAEIRRLGRKISREQVQLYYQIALHGRNDLGLAPDEYAGFTMTLLRMLAFAPELAAPAAAPARGAALLAAKPLRSSVPPRASARPDAPAHPSPRTEAVAPDGDGTAAGSTAGTPAAGTTAPAADALLGGTLGSTLDWPALAVSLKLTGLARELALRSELVAAQGDQLTLRVPVKALLEAGGEARLRAALQEHFGRPIGLITQLGATGGATAASRSEQARAALQKQAEEAIYADPFVRELTENFGASVDARSIRPAAPDA
jgi:DNA polymerase-3 subunit gamma/tau